MKKISKYILAALAALPMLAGCNIAEFGDQHIYKPGEQDPDGCYGVYFPEQEAAGSHILDPAAERKIVITAKRTNTVGDIVVPVVVSGNESGVFSIGEVSFLDGVEETSFNVDFPNAETAVQYNLTIQVVDKQYASKYTQNATSVDLSVMIVKWEKFFGPGATEATSKGTFTQVCWEEEYNVDMYYYDSPYPNIRACKLVEGWQGNVAKVDCIFYWNTTSNYLYVPQQWMGYVTSAGAYVYSGAACDFYNAYYAWGMVCPSTEYFDWAAAWNIKNSFLQPHYDGNGGFYLGDWTYSGSAAGVPTGSGWQFGGSSDLDMDIFVAAGFDRSEYDVRLLESDYTVDGKTPVYVQVGKTSKAIKYATVKGSLTKTTAAYVAQDIAEGKIGTIVTDLKDDFDVDGKPVVSTALDLEFDETGDYSIVVVTFEDAECTEEKAKANDFLNFYHVTKADTEKYSVQITAGAEDTPSRYSAYTTSNSFQFYLVGTEITNACIYVVATETYEENTELINASVKAGLPDSEGNTSYVSEEVLALINQDGGYCTIIDGLKALTSYTAVVWATNDAEDIIKTVTYTTSGLPLEKIATGTYQYCSLWGGTAEPATLYVDPNLEDTYVLDPVWGNVKFAFNWDGKDKVSVPFKTDSGVDYSAGNRIYVFENDDVASTPTGVPSSYDDATKTFTFHVAFYVFGLGGWFNKYEFFTIDEAESVAQNFAKGAKKAVKADFEAKNVKNIKNIPMAVTNNKAVERIPQTVDCKASFGTRKPNFSIKPANKPAEKSSNLKSVEKF